MSESANFDDKIVIVPVELSRDKKVPGAAIALYVVMKSFGPRAEASIGAYGSRLRWDDETVRKWQKVLVVSGWITLIREGRNRRPRLWWMCRVRNEKPPQQVEVTPPKNQGVKKPGGEKTHPSKKAGGEKTLPKAVEGFQAVEPKTSNRESGSPQASPKVPKTNPQAEPILALLDPWRIRCSLYGRALERDDANLKAAPKALEVYANDLVPAYKLFLADRSNWLVKAGHPLRTFAKQPESYRPAPKAPDKKYCARCQGTRKVYETEDLKGTPCPDCHGRGDA